MDSSILTRARHCDLLAHAQPLAYTSGVSRRKATREQALVQIKRLKDGFSAYIATRFAWKAVDCGSCPAPCCGDAEFVNVNITRLEGEAIMRTLENSPRISPEHRRRIIERARDAVDRYGLDRTSDTFSTTYACPLFEPGRGCLVHYKAKPAPCIQHGCYDDWRDLPDEIELHRVEQRVARWNADVFGDDRSAWGFQTIPVWIARLADEKESVQETQPSAKSVDTQSKRPRKQRGKSG